MSARDIKVISAGYGVREFDVDDRDTSSATATHKPGEPLKRNNANFALLCATGDPEIGTDIFLGICAKESTEVAATDGVVDIQVCGPGTVIRGRATTATNSDTAAELLGLQMDYVTFDLTGSAFTLDENEGDDPNVHGLCIVGGSTTKGTLDAAVHANVTLFGPLVGQTMD